jgi:arylsulfatase A-like enzyme
MRRPTSHSIAALAALALLTVAGCGEPEPTVTPRLVLLYAPCTVSKTLLSPYDDSIAYTPQLAAFADDARVFRRHQTEAGSSGIAYASIFSGSQADAHGIFRHPAILSDDRYLVFEAFAENGFDTFFWNGHPMAGPNYGQGVKKTNRTKKRLQADDPRFRKLLDRLRRDPSYRALIVTNFTVTHGPYSLKTVAQFVKRFPEEAGRVTARDIDRYGKLYLKHHHGISWNFAEKVAALDLSKEEADRLIDVVTVLYKARLAELDRMFGEVVEQVDAHGLREQSIIVFTADHGELLYRDDPPFKFAHSMQLAPEVLGVPLMIRSNDPAVGTEDVQRVTRSIDVFPTLAGLSGIPLQTSDATPSGGIRGVDLSAPLRGEQPFPRLLAFSHTTVLVHSVFKQMYWGMRMGDWSLVRRYFPDESPERMWTAVRDGDLVYKLRAAAGGSMSPSVFDLANDPGETRDLYQLDDTEQQARFAELAAYKARLVERYNQMDEGRALLPQEEELKRLKSLGYVQ